tara:strand:+ start:43 stop:495 length:453 start_codon:yes stop_codon:yes gene_type:complete
MPKENIGGWLKKHPKLDMLLAFIVLLILVSAFSSNEDDSSTSTISENTKTLDKEKFNQLAMQSLHNNGFCYERMEEVEGFSCGEIAYPFIRIYGAEGYTEEGKILVVTLVTDDLYETIPDLYNTEIIYIFRDINQKTIDRIYMEKDEWSR